MQRNYMFAAGIILVLIFGVLIYFSVIQQGGDHWTVTSPSAGYVAKDEFIPVTVSVSLSSRNRADLPGNTWLVLYDRTKKENYILPFSPREVGVYEDNQSNAIVFGKDGPLSYGSNKDFSGYAYLSPLIQDGTYDAHVAFGHFGGEKVETPVEYSQSGSFPLTVKREFFTSKSLEAKVLPGTGAAKDGSQALLHFSLKSTDTPVTLRAFEMGKLGNGRLPEAVKVIALYDADTGEKLSDLTDTKVKALTIEAFTPYVLDTALVIPKESPKNLELRAMVDPTKINTDPSDNAFVIPRIYGINEADQKIAEQVQLSGKVTK